MNVKCPKCKVNLSYYYHKCKRHDDEQDHLKCYCCGAWFDVRTLRRVCPITVFSRAINYDTDLSIHVKYVKNFCELDEASELILNYIP